MTCAPAWISPCAAPLRTAPARSARISIRIGKQTAISWPVFAEMREQWKGRIALQASPCSRSSIAAEDEPQFRAIVQAVARHGGILGGVTFLGDPPGPKLELALDRIFAAAIAQRPRPRPARRRELLARRPQPRAHRARRAAPPLQGSHRRRPLLLARASLRRGSRRASIERVGEAGIAVVSLPMCNMYLQDRGAGARRAGAASRRCTSSMPPAFP